MAQGNTSTKKTNTASSAGKSTAKSGAKSTAAGSSKAAAKTSSRQPVSAEPPIRRELAGGVFAALAVFVIISYFNTDGTVIAFAANLFKGLLGWGYWLAAAAFLLVAFVLFFHKGRPVALRVSSALLLPILLAAIGQLIACDSIVPDFKFEAALNGLFEGGQALECGGVLGGFTAAGLEVAFSIYGALPILIVCFVLFLLIAVRGNLSGLFSGKGRKPHQKYDPAMYETAAAPAPRAAKPMVDVPIAPVPAPPKTTRKKQRTSPAFQTDLPLGDEGVPLLLNDLGYVEQEPYVAQTPASRRAKVHKRAAGVETVSPKLRDELYSLDDEADFREVPVPVKEERKPVSMSTEILDPPRVKKISRAELEAEAVAVAAAVADSGEKPDYEFPPLSLLRSSTAGAVDAKDEISLNRERLEGAIRSFGISAAIVGVTRGPTVTRYDIELDQGVKLARITNLAGDLALALGVINVRIAPIPDKISTVGIEVPNKIVSTVYLRDIIESQKFSSAKSKLSFSLGKDISGDCIVGNIAKLPHMLIAGTTGSGKSVCMNSLILSLLYKARPDEVRLIMIDPKMVELGIYNGIPHLYVPVVTDPKKAAGALQWSVVEMLKRYRTFSEMGVRDLESYNKNAAAAGEATLPQVVIVIDELADLMLVASKDVEESICRVAQMGRAAGMHLVIATQRPSADVITGLMKANIPSRIAFAVSSAMESRIILDQGGAEKLVGMGDMLFSPVGIGKPMRIQGAFVSDEEREDVIQFIKESAKETQQNAEIEQFMNQAAEGGNASDSGKNAKDDSPAGDYDEMLPQAVEVVIEAGSCSVSMLQRRVKLGYSRAARIVDQMEEIGVVGPYEGAKPRKVLVDRSGWHDIQVELGMVEDDIALAAQMSETADEYNFEG